MPPRPPKSHKLIDIGKLKEKAREEKIKRKNIEKFEKKMRHSQTVKVNSEVAFDWFEHKYLMPRTRGREYQKAIRFQHKYRREIQAAEKEYKRRVAMLDDSAKYKPTTPLSEIEDEELYVEELLKIEDSIDELMVGQELEKKEEIEKGSLFNDETLNMEEYLEALRTEELHLDKEVVDKYKQKI